MDDDAAEGLVLHLEDSGLTILYLEIMGSVIQFEPLSGLDLHGIIGTVLQSEESTAIFICGDGVDQFIVDLPDLESGVRDPLTGIIRVDLDDLYATHRIVIHRDRLGILGIDLHRLDPCGLVDGVPLDGLGFLDHDGACDSADADLTVLIGGIKALTGQVPIGVVHIAAVRVGQFELHPGQRLLCDGVQFPDDESALGLVVEAQSLHLASLDLDTLGSSI